MRRIRLTDFAKAYDEVRRGIAYLRWHEGDIDEIAPSVYSGRVGRRRKAEGDAEPAQPMGQSATETADEAPSTVLPQPAVNAAAHPDGSPFVS